MEKTSVPSEGMPQSEDRVEEWVEEWVEGTEEMAFPDAHDLYLPRLSQPLCAPIRFSNNMDVYECKRYYRSLISLEVQNDALEEKVKTRTGSRLSIFKRLRRETKGRSTKKVNPPVIIDNLQLSRSSSTSSIMTDATDATDSADSTDSAKESFQERFTIQFDEYVTVHPVPMINDYPADVHAAIWMPAEEMLFNKIRNRREFAYDSFSWRNALEENYMVRDEETGELVHPANIVRPVESRQGSRKAVVGVAVPA